MWSAGLRVSTLHPLLAEPAEALVRAAESYELGSCNLDPPSRFHHQLRGGEGPHKPNAPQPPRERSNHIPLLRRCAPPHRAERLEPLDVGTPLPRRPIDTRLVGDAREVDHPVRTAPERLAANAASVRPTEVNRA